MVWSYVAITYTDSYKINHIAILYDADDTSTTWGSSLKLPIIK